MNIVQLDDIDCCVVEELQRDSRSTYAQIGVAVGLSAAAVHARVKNLERRGVITGFGARVDAEAVGLPVTAFRAPLCRLSQGGAVVWCDVPPLHGGLPVQAHAASPVCTRESSPATLAADLWTLTGPL